MTHRERILAALQHQESDRVPVELGATESSGMMAIAYNNLKRRLGLSGRTQIFDVMCMTAKIEPAVLDIVGSDAIALYNEPREWKPWTLQDGSSAEIPQKANLKRLDTGEVVELSEDGTVLTRCPPGGHYMDPTVWPLEHAHTLEDIDAATPLLSTFGWQQNCDETLDDLSLRARRLHEDTSYAVVANLCLHLFLASQLLRGFENFFADLLVDKPLAHHMLGKLLDGHLARAEKYIEAVGPYVDVILVNDDLGMQNGPQIAPALYREMIKPYHQELWQFIKRKSGKPLLLHSCGSIYDLIPDFIEMGVDALNPIQVTAANMEPARLKKEFGRDITFWGGGCDTQTVLARGTPTEVREEVRRNVDIFAPGGGFVFCQVHNILYDVPVENVLAMYEELGTLTGA